MKPTITIFTSNPVFFNICLILILSFTHSTEPGERCIASLQLFCTSLLACFSCFGCTSLSIVIYFQNKYSPPWGEVIHLLPAVLLHCHSKSSPVSVQKNSLITIDSEVAINSFSVKLSVSFK